MIKTGLTGDLIVAILFIAFGAYSIWKVKSGGSPGIKRAIPAMDGIKEGIGVCAELGRPLSYATGPGALQTTAGTEIVAAMAVLDYVARVCARSRVPVYLSVYDSASLVYGNQVLRQAYTAEGQLDVLPDDAVRYYGQSDPSYSYGINRTMAESNAAAHYMVGAWDASSSISAEEGAVRGLFQVGGAALHFKGALPFFVATCEYTFICEELYAAGALLTEDEGMLGTLLSTDYMRATMIVLILAGMLLSTMGSTIIADFLNM
jgi:hypothetical protein